MTRRANFRMRIQSKISRRCVLFLAACLTWVAAGSTAFAQAGTIEEIIIQGLSRMSRPAFLHAFGIDEGQPYDPAKVRTQFKELWQTGLFQDIVIDAEEGLDGGTVLVIKIKERPRVASVDYEETRVLSRTEIEDALKQRDIQIRSGQPLDLGKIYEAESTLRDVLSQKGYLGGRVEAEIERVTENTRAINFRVSAGGKTRIRSIDFVGNELYKDGRLLTALELTQPRRWWWPWSKKNLYHEVKWDQDVGNIRDLYLNAGYLDVELRPPVVEVRDKKGNPVDREELTPFAARDQAEAEMGPPPEPPGFSADVDDAQRRKLRARYDKAKKKYDKKLKKRRRALEKKAGKKWVHLTVRVNEGPTYALGDVSFDGNEVFQDDLLRAIIPMRKGSTFNNQAAQIGVDRITRLYENRGHLYANVVRNIKRREDGELIADLDVVVEENDPFFVDRIQFSGNSATLDGVLRRELFINEGERFNRDKLEVSRVKLNQLGYWQAVEEPVIDPNDEEQTVLVTISGEEQGRNEVQIGGGYSGLDGAFFNGVYSTRNFLGRGQVLSTAIQIGGRSNRYQISFQEPWFLNRPLLLGFNLFRRDIDFGASLESTSSGGGIILGRRLGRFSRLNVGYNYETVDSETRLFTGGSDFTTVRTTNEISSLTPVFNYTTINNPYRPTSGENLQISAQIAGGPLGGNTSFIKPIMRATAYTPLFRKAYLGVHLQAGYVTEWDRGSDTTSSTIEGIPRFQRFWLGGDTQGPRVFEVRTITPLRFVGLNDNNQIETVLGDPAFQAVGDLVTNGLNPVVVEVGGDRYFLYQSEIVVPVNDQVDLVGFLDLGDSYFEDQSLNFETVRMSGGIELRFNLPIFPVPLRLIYGVPIRKLEGDRTASFSFSIGRSF